ncbi:MAG: hypothetical protein KDC33_10685 [Thermoleophilia bacterium]|nr:hypothetical protein [Thermoleophilia bacterium]
MNTDTVPSHSAPEAPGSATRHGYFTTSNGVPLLGHLHGGTAERGVAALIVAPFGWEDVCSYRPRRALARRLAAEGIPTLRFDAPGAGDSAGDASLPGRVDAWIDAVARAAQVLRDETGCARAVAVGIGPGAVVAGHALLAGALLDAAVLWPAVGRGRQFVREMAALRRLERQEYASEADDGEDDGTVAGFLADAAFRDALSALDLADAAGSGSLAGARVLAMGRDGIAPDARLVDALRGGGASVETDGGAGYGAMMADPQAARIHGDTSARIAGFCLDVGQDLPAGDVTAVLQPTARVADGVDEHPVELRAADDGPTLFGLWCRPAGGAAADRVAVFLNAGSVRHIGPNRLWVEMARDLARRGIPSLRADLSGIGDGDGDEDLRTQEAGLHDPSLVVEARHVVDAALAGSGAARAGLVGLCSGAAWSAHVAADDMRVDRAVMINPRYIVWDQDVADARETASASTSVLRRSAWRKLAEGRVTPRRAAAVAHAMLTRAVGAATRRRSSRDVPPAAADVVRRLGRPGLRALFVFTAGEPLLEELEADRLLARRDAPDVVRLEDAGHTLRPRWAQERAIEIVSRHVAGDDRPA